MQKIGGSNMDILLIILYIYLLSSPCIFHPHTFKSRLNRSTISKPARGGLKMQGPKTQITKSSPCVNPENDPPKNGATWGSLFTTVVTSYAAGHFQPNLLGSFLEIQT